MNVFSIFLDITFLRVLKVERTLFDNFLCVGFNETSSLEDTSSDIDSG